MAYGNCDLETKRYAAGDQSPIDVYTGGHVAIGAIYGCVGVKWYTALGLAVAWEAAEDAIKSHIPDAFPDACRDTIPNLVTDIAAVMAGWGVGRYVRWFRLRSYRAAIASPPARKGQSWRSLL